MGTIRLWGTSNIYPSIYTCRKDRTNGDVGHLGSSCVKLSGYDFTSRVGSKAAALKNITESLASFGRVKDVDDHMYQDVEKYLINLNDPTAKCNTFDELRYYTYKKRNKSITDIPPTSASIHGHLMRCHYVVFILSHLLDPTKLLDINPIFYGWERTASVLTPIKWLSFLPEAYATRCGCKKKCTLRCKCHRLEANCTEVCQCGNSCAIED